MLFVLDSAGVPSVAKILRIGVASNPEPGASRRRSTNPGDQTSRSASPSTCSSSPADPNGDPLTLLGQRPAARPDARPDDRPHQRHADTPAATTCRHRERRHQRRLRELRLDRDQRRGAARSRRCRRCRRCSPAPAWPATPRAPAAASTCSTSWNFGDGTPHGLVDLRRPPPTRSRAPGIYYVTVTANDDRGIPVSRTACRRSTCRRRARADRLVQLAFEPRATRQRAAVGREPGQRLGHRVRRRHARQAARDQRRHRAALDRRGAERPDLGDQPAKRDDQRHRSGHARGHADDRAAARLAAVRHRVRAGGAHAFVALEAPPASCSSSTPPASRSSAACVGPNPRHVSIAAERRSVYVSRFITPPLPGEGTRVVQTTVGTTDYGGEVVVVDAARR